MNPPTKPRRLAPLESDGISTCEPMGARNELYRVHNGKRWLTFASLSAAVVYCGNVFSKTGVVASVVANTASPTS